MDQNDSLPSDLPGVCLALDFKKSSIWASDIQIPTVIKIYFSDCACQKDSTWARVKEVQNLNGSLPARFAFGDYAGVYNSAKKIKGLYDELEVHKVCQTPHFF